MKTSPAPYSVTATTYDHRNLATAVTRAAVTTSYRYNEGGWRIAKQVGTGNQELYIQDGPLTLAVFTLNASGTLVSWTGNVLAGTKVVGRQPSVGNRSYYHTDLLGTTRAVLQGAVVVESYDYDPYGMLMPGRTLAGTTKEGFTSKERDVETGLDYFGARYYMGAVGRWTAVDPVADSFPQWTPYSYVMGNPVALTDPFGLAPCPPDCDSELLSLAERGFREGGFVGGLKVAAGIGGSTALDFFGVNDAVDASAALGEGRYGAALAAAAFATPAGKGGRAAKGLVGPTSFFGSKTASQLSEAFKRKFGPARSVREGAETFFNPRTGRSFNIHTDPAHGAPHIDVRRRGPYEERKYSIGGGS